MAHEITATTAAPYHHGSHNPHRVGRNADGEPLYACPEGFAPHGGCYLDKDGLVVVPAGEQYDVRPVATLHGLVGYLRRETEKL